jgi:histidine triad (HIT) family protein
MTCIVCDKIKEKKALIVYEDDSIIAILPTKPAVPGHIKIMPKEHASKLEELSDDVVEELFFVANYSSAAVFEALKAQGTNVILNEGDAHLVMDVIPRKENDGLSFTWKPKQLSPTEMDEANARIKDKAFTVGKSEKKEDPKPASPTGPATIVVPGISQPVLPASQDKKDEVIKIPKEDKINYLIKHLQKIP